MKNFIYFYLSLIFVQLIINSQIVFSQTEYDYFKKQRLEKKAKKIKTISSFDYLDDALSEKIYYDEEGFLIKKEIYASSFVTGNAYISQEVIVNKYNDNEDISGSITVFKSDGSKVKNLKFNNMKPEIFYEISSFDEIQYDNVNYIFDNKGILTEKRFFSKKNFNSDEYARQLLFYNSNGKLIEYKYYTPGTTTVSFGKYYYNSNDLLEKEESSYDFQKGERVYGTRYEYEFY